MPVKSDEEKRHTLSSTKALFQEIKSSAGCSDEKIAETLSLEAEKVYADPEQITGAFVSQYRGGHKAASLKRRKQFAEIALKLGWGGHICWLTLHERAFGEALYDTEPEVSKHFAKIEKALDSLLAMREHPPQLIFDLISKVKQLASRYDVPPDISGIVDTNYGPMWMRVQLTPLAAVNQPNSEATTIIG